MSEQPDTPDAGADDVPAEVPDFVDPASVVIEGTPLDEDTSEAADPGDSDEFDAMLAEGES